MNSDYLQTGEFAVIAHRGGSLEAPENTMAAFSHAYKVNQKIYFELDVHQTRDKEIVVHHDGTVDRTTNGTGSIANLSYKELSQFDAGYRFTLDNGKTFPFRDQGCHIPKLKDVLTAFPTTRLSIELKDGPVFFGGNVAKVITETQSQKRVCIAGENHKALSQAAALMPEVCSGFSAKEMLINFYCAALHLPSFIGAKRAQVMQIPYSHNGRTIASPNFINRAHKQGLFVHVWTVNDEETMRHLLKIGADGIITDAPTLLTRVLLKS